LSDDACFTEESHFAGLLEYPQYTRPAVWNNREVPSVLLSGNHAEIDKWRKQRSIEITLQKRPDILKNAQLNKKELQFLNQLK
jgi:tRNA (guanine37-N1)-methyltransferase